MSDPTPIWRCMFGDGSGVVYYEGVDSIPSGEPRPIRQLGYWLPAAEFGHLLPALGKREEAQR